MTFFHAIDQVESPMKSTRGSGFAMPDRCLLLCYLRTWRYCFYMLTYAASGTRHFVTEPEGLRSRRVWEFFACLSGRVGLVLPDHQKPEWGSKTLWAFPAEHVHGWTSVEPVDRLVFQHTVVPKDLEQFVPHRGYYQVALTGGDFEQLHRLMALAKQIMKRPTTHINLQTQTVVAELSLMAARDVNAEPLPLYRFTRFRVEFVLAWYRDHMNVDRPVEAAADRIHVSPVHLRRMFRRVLGETPRAVFNRIRMERVDFLLSRTDLTLEAIASEVGLADSASLSRAVQAYFGELPGEKRKTQRQQASRGRYGKDSRCPDLTRSTSRSL